MINPKEAFVDGITLSAAVVTIVPTTEAEVVTVEAATWPDEH